MMQDLIKAFEQQSASQLSGFFHDNAGTIDQLIQLYDAYNQKNTRKQMQRIRDLKQRIRLVTGDNRWADLDGLELYYQFNHPGYPPVRIEAGYNTTRTDATGEFVINITTADIQAWNYYEDQLLQRFTITEPLIATDKTLLQVACIPHDNEAEILSALEMVYEYMCKLTGRVLEKVVL